MREVGRVPVVRLWKLWLGHFILHVMVGSTDYSREGCEIIYVLKFFSYCCVENG
jgi:hypothetical protein